jgi:phospholipid transport system substrate-binding protein
MKQKRIQAIQGLVILLLYAGGLSWAYAGEPLDIVKTAADKAVQILSDNHLRSNDKKQERIERLREIFNPIFDYDEMAKRALGAHWRRRTPAEQNEFIKLFREFLEGVYSDKVNFYEGQKVIFGRETIEKDFAEVESKVVNTKGEEISVIYRLRRADGKWKVYDARVENVSTVNNYRSQFDRIISKYSYNELIRLLLLRGKVA